MRAHRIHAPRFAALVATLAALSTAPASALEFPDLDLGWDGSRAQEVTAATVDLAIVRPIAAARVLIGGMLFVPAAVFSAPMGREGFEGALDTLVIAPSEFAFDREIGEL